MRSKLLIGNAAYLLFGTTVYVGVLWALHFFWYPSWRVMTIAAAEDHFVAPTSAATKFFTVVVPLMFVTNLVLAWSERKHRRFLVAALVALIGITGSTFVGQLFIIPINQEVHRGVSDPAHFSALMQRWMFLNDIRWVLMSVMWIALVYYFVARGRLAEALDTPS